MERAAHSEEGRAWSFSREICRQPRVDVLMPDDRQRKQVRPTKSAQSPEWQSKRKLHDQRWRAFLAGTLRTDSFSAKAVFIKPTKYDPVRFAKKRHLVHIVYELTSPRFLSEGSASASYWLTISKNLPLITACLPSFRVQNVLNGLLSFALKSDEDGAQILSDVGGFKGNQLVFDSLLAHVPSFDASSDLLHKALSCSIADGRFLGRVSRFFDFWLGCSGIVNEQLSKLIEVYIDESEKPDVMLSTFGFCSMSLSLNDRLERLVSLVSFGKVMLSCRKPAPAIEAVLRLFIALICSSPADIPFHWLAMDVVDLMFARWRYYWKALTKESKFCEHFDVIVAFFFPCFLLDGLSMPVQNAVKGVLLYILASHPDIVRPYVEGKGAVWEKLIL